MLGEAAVVTAGVLEPAAVPAVVAAYFRRTLPAGTTPPTRVEIVQAGQLALKGRWRDFTAVQRLSAAPPRFAWDARVRLAPLLIVHVRDRYTDGMASIRASVAGVIPLVNEAGGTELRVGALQRYLAEAIWMPAALLPRSGVTWAPVDERRAIATIKDSGSEASLEFTFNADGEVSRVFTPSRPRAIDGRYEPTPWEARVWNYADRGGTWLPFDSEVSWRIDGRWQPWWHGRVVRVTTPR